MRAKFINEKFSDETDPVHDMGIGIMHVREFDTLEEAAKFFVDGIRFFSKGKVGSPEELKTAYDRREVNADTTGDPSPLKLCHDYLKGWDKEYEPILIKELENDFGNHPTRLQYLKDFKDAVYDELKKRFRPKISYNVVVEKFSEGGDPIKQLGIGRPTILKLFKKRLKEFYKDAKKYGDPFEVRGLTEAIGIASTYIDKYELDGIDQAIKSLKTNINDWNAVEFHLDRGEHVPGIIRSHYSVINFLEAFKHEYIK